MDENELKRMLDLHTAETRHHFDETADRIRQYLDVSTEGLKHEIRLVAEAVVQVNEKLEREAADIRQELRIGFAETQAMIKFSHAELDRRVRSLEGGQRALEDSLADLQARVERLESSTH